MKKIKHGGMPKNLYLVRHGESEGNLARKKFVENGDAFSVDFLAIHESQYELTSLGVNQAKQAGEWFKENKITKFHRMLVSNNVRARKTAGYLDLPNAIWLENFRLRERDGGLFNTITPEERDVKYPNEQKFYDEQPFLWRPPQGESVADVCDRIKIILDMLSRKFEGKNVIIVCHGHVMRAFRIELERMSLSNANEFLSTKDEWGRVPNCSILHYTRKNPFKKKEDLSDSFGWMRMIRPAGGGIIEDEFSPILRKKYSNQQLLG